MKKSVNTNYTTRVLFMFLIALAASALLTFWLADVNWLESYAPFSLDWTGSSLVLFSFYFFFVFDVLVLAVEGI